MQFQTPYTPEPKQTKTRHIQDTAFMWLVVAILFLIALKIAVSVTTSIIELYLIGLV